MNASTKFGLFTKIKKKSGTYLYIFSIFFYENFPNTIYSLH